MLADFKSSQRMPVKAQTIPADATPYQLSRQVQNFPPNYPGLCKVFQYYPG
jgi:hypothetical protein